MPCFQGKNEVFCYHPPTCTILRNTIEANQTIDCSLTPAGKYEKKYLLLPKLKPLAIAILMSLRQSDSGFITLLLIGIIINDFTTRLLQFFWEEFVFSSPFLI